MRVTGVIQDTHYDVEVKAGSPPVGSTAVARLVEAWSGKSVLGGPTGPRITVNPTEPRSVLALLSSRTTVTGVTDAEEQDRPRPVGRVH